ncbi:insulinase family protein [bacterium]|nr:insulinase family protein [bacterium]
MMREFILENGIKTCIKQNENTPRVALTLNISINEPETFAGEYSLMNRLLLKGTKKYSSEEIANILDENAIELYTEMKSDYIRYRFVCLNEDFQKALSMLTDIVLNSTFDEFDKEKVKMKGELMAELDSAKVKASDMFTKTIYKNHYYGHTYTSIIEEVDNVKKEDVVSAYKRILETGRKTIALVGDVDVEDRLNETLGQLPRSTENTSVVTVPSIEKREYAEIIKEDANQAQIFQGWIVPTLGSEDYPAIMLLNIILGASGLSSRLFLELREKKGLAYTVRTSYETLEKSAVFSIYIGTEPSNIQTSIDGFKVEIDKIKEVPISEEELHNAKNNLLGKLQFLSETNSQQANIMAYYSIMGRPFSYRQRLVEKIKNVTVSEIQNCAKKYFTDKYALTILKP